MMKRKNDIPQQTKGLYNYLVRASKGDNFSNSCYRHQYNFYPFLLPTSSLKEVQFLYINPFILSTNTYKHIWHMSSAMCLARALRQQAKFYFCRAYIWGIRVERNTMDEYKSYVLVVRAMRKNIRRE